MNTNAGTPTRKMPLILSLGQADWTLGQADWTLGQADWTLGQADWTLGQADWSLGQVDWTFGVRSIGSCLRILPILHPDEYYC